MGKQEINPMVAGAVILVAVLLLGFFLWRRTATPVYNGPPIDMGAQMRGGGGAPPPGGPGGTGR